MSRKSGCPFNIRDYAVSIRNPVTEELVRVKGLDSMSVEAEAETGDGLEIETEEMPEASFDLEIDEPEAESGLEISED